MNNQKLLFLVNKSIARDMPKWLWIFWLPQVLQFMTLPKDDVLLYTCKMICHYMCASYPQVIWYPLKAICEYHRDLQSPNKIYDTMVRKIVENKNKKLANGMMQVMKELYLISRATQDERLIATLKRILNFSDHLS